MKTIRVDVLRSNYDRKLYALGVATKDDDGCYRIAGPKAGPWTTERSFVLDPAELRRWLDRNAPAEPAREPAALPGDPTDRCWCGHDRAGHRLGGHCIEGVCGCEEFATEAGGAP